MNTITPAQLNDFLDYAIALIEPPENFHCVINFKREEIEKSTQVYVRSFIIMSIVNPESAMLSCLMTGFQLGRLYENRAVDLREMEVFK